MMSQRQSGLSSSSTELIPAQRQHVSTAVSDLSRSVAATVRSVSSRPLLPPSLFTNVCSHQHPAHEHATATQGTRATRHVRDQSGMTPHHTTRAP
jgi:hypothetical protein